MRWDQLCKVSLSIAQWTGNENHLCALWAHVKSIKNYDIYTTVFDFGNFLDLVLVSEAVKIK